MDVLTGVLAGSAVLLVMAGAAKVVDPSRTVGALRALGWPSSEVLVRGAAAGELVLGVAALAVGGPALAMLVAASYLGFAVFVVVALGAGTPLGTCGCFGRVDTEPRATHVVVDVLLAAGAVTAGVADAPALLDASWIAWPVAALVAVVSYGLLTGVGAGVRRRV